MNQNVGRSRQYLYLEYRASIFYQSRSLMMHLGRSSRPTSGEALPAIVCAVCLLSVLSAVASAAVSVSAPCSRQLLAISREASPVLSEEDRRNTRRSSRGLLVSVVIADRSEGIESLLLTLSGSPFTFIVPWVFTLKEVTFCC